MYIQINSNTFYNKNSNDLYFIKKSTDESNVDFLKRKYKSVSEELAKIQLRINDPTTPDDERTMLDEKREQLRDEHYNLMGMLETPHLMGELSRGMTNIAIKNNMQENTVLDDFDPAMSIKEAENVLKMISRYKPEQGQEEIDKQALTEEVNSFITTLRYLESQVKDAIKNLAEMHGQELNSIKNRIKEIYEQLSYIPAVESLDMNVR